MASSTSGPNARRNTMLPMMCIQPPCMNIAVKMVIQWWPATMLAGISDHLNTNASPPISSITKTITFTTMIPVVTTGKLLGRRDASDNGIMPPTLSSSVSQCFFHVNTAHRLLFQQLLRQCFMGRPVLLQQRLSTLVLFGHETLDFPVDHLTSLGTELAVVLDRSPQVLELLTCVAHRPELFTHTKLRDHPAGQVSCPRDVVTGPGADGPELHHFAGPPA